MVSNNMFDLIKTGKQLIIKNIKDKIIKKLFND